MRRLALSVGLAAVLVVGDASAAGAMRPWVFPGFDGQVRVLTSSERSTMTGVSWKPGCPVGLDDLRVVDAPYIGFDGKRHRSTLVVNKDVAVAVNQAFSRMLTARFPMFKVTMVDEVGGDDDRALAANLTTAFNCRTVAGTNRWSEHAYGRAIDINPIQNPYVSGSTVAPPAGRAYLNRSKKRLGMLTAPSAPVKAFKEIGWGWGGTFTSIKDYQHVSASGR